MQPATDAVPVACVVACRSADSNKLPLSFPVLSIAKKRGIKTVITLREKNEIDWDEAAALEQLELNFYQLGFRAPDSLTPTLIEKTVKIMGDPKRTPVMLHCASANRVGALWLAHRVLNDKLDIATARKEAKIVGLRTPAYEERVLSYIKKKQVAK